MSWTPLLERILEKPNIKISFKHACIYDHSFNLVASVGADDSDFSKAFFDAAKSKIIKTSSQEDLTIPNQYRIIKELDGVYMIKGKGIKYCFAYAGKDVEMLFFLFSDSNNCNDVFKVRDALGAYGMK